MSAKKEASAGTAGMRAAAIGATVTLRTYFSRDHVYSARYSVARVKAIEESKDQPPNPQEHRMYVINAVLSSVAYLEASVNEPYQDAADGVDEYLARLSREGKERLAEVWKGERRLSTLEKYQIALTCVNQPKFDTGVKLYQAVRDVIKLRNGLVHPLPTSHEVGSKDEHDLAKMLRVRGFSQNPFAAAEHPLFPDKYLGYGCAKWALDSCTSFVREFDSRVGLVRT